jgi:hypothetical protein
MSIDYSQFKLLYNGKYGNIYDPGVKGLIVCEFWGVWRVEDAECIKDFKMGAELIIKNKAIVDICDHRKQHVVTMDIGKWFINNWYKKLYANGLKYEICVVPELNAAKISFNRLISKETIENVKIETYDSIDKAYSKALKYIK